MDDVREKALDVGRRAACDWRNQRYGDKPTYGPGDMPDALVDSLIAAGLLQTGVERECVEACKDGARAICGPHSRWKERALNAGRAALEVEKPKPRWVVREMGGPLGLWKVLFEGQARSQPYAEALTEAQAKAVAAALNGLEGA